MLNDKVEAALNDQLQMELQSAYVYLAMSASCEANSLPGMASWLRVQWQEEIEHAMKFYNFIVDRDGRVELRTLDAPKKDYGSPLEVFEDALEHEKTVSQAISELYSIMVDERDYASQAWLDWFATEQVEEEKMVGQIVDTLRRIGDRGDALYLLDKELGARTA